MELYASREKGAKIQTAKAMDDAFLRAGTSETSEIARSIEAWNAQQTSELEQLLFRRCKRLVGAERTL